MRGLLIDNAFVVHNRSCTFSPFLLTPPLSKSFTNLNIGESPAKTTDQETFLVEKADHQEHTLLEKAVGPFDTTEVPGVKICSQ